MPKHIEELVAQQIRRSEAAHERISVKGEPCNCNIITISRTMGSGARIIAGKLAADLDWSLWDKEILEAIAEDAHVSQKIAESFDEHKRSEIEIFVHNFLGEYDVGGFIYAKHLAKAVASVSKLGNAIILGRGANVLLRHALNIRIDASEEIRVRNMMQYENLTDDEAIKKIRQSDIERRKFIIHTFGKERVENAHFNLSLWMDEFTNDDAVYIIKAALSRVCSAVTLQNHKK
ncbi:MAG: cytidylate kinase-like family protein [Armatimonadota bacterium]